MRDKTRAIVILIGLPVVVLIVNLIAKFVQVVLNLDWTNSYRALNFIPVVYIVLLVIALAVVVSTIINLAHTIYLHHHKR